MFVCSGVVLGVAQLCNKKTGTYFTTFDEDIASAFAVYCCISISHVSWLFCIVLGLICCNVTILVRKYMATCTRYFLLEGYKMSYSHR